MANTATLAQLEATVAQLPPQDQLKLVARISARLSDALPIGFPQRTGKEQILQDREAEADALLTELDAVAESIEGEFDSAEDIRQIRAERATGL